MAEPPMTREKKTLYSFFCQMVGQVVECVLLCDSSNILLDVEILVQASSGSDRDDPGFLSLPSSSLSCCEKGSCVTQDKLTMFLQFYHWNVAAA